MKYYVYIYCDPHTGEIRYVGSGRRAGRRAMTRHLEPTSDSPVKGWASQFDVDWDEHRRIVGSGLTQKEALRLETRIFDRLRPQLVNTLRPMGHKKPPTRWEPVKIRRIKKFALDMANFMGYTLPKRKKRKPAKFTRWRSPAERLDFERNWIPSPPKVRLAGVWQRCSGKDAAILAFRLDRSSRLTRRRNLEKMGKI